MPDPATPARYEGRLPRWYTVITDQAAYQLRLVSRSPRSLCAGILLPVLVLLMHGADTSDPRARLALVGGLAALGVISSAFVTHTNTLVIGREAGVLRRWRMTPVPSACYFAGKIIATVVVADASALVTVLVAALTGVPVTAAAAAWMLLPTTIGAVAWASLGTGVSAFIPTATAAYPLLTVIYLPIALMSGALGAVSQPAWMRTLATCLPARALTLATTRALQHPGSRPLPGVSQTAVLTAWILIGIALANRCFRWNPTPARRAPRSSHRRPEPHGSPSGSGAATPPSG